MKDYSLAKIYKLISPSGLIYVGSTCEPTLARRKAKHRGDYKCWKRGKTHFVTSYYLFDEDDDGVEIVLLENCPCASKDELYARERYYIDCTVCVNKNIPARTKKQYNIDNKDKVADYLKHYRVDNRERILDNKHQYYIDNKDTISERHKQKFECVCNGKYTHQNKQRHSRSITHQQYIKEQQFEAFIQTNPTLDDAVKHAYLFI
jgi:hypothetical protein